MWLALGLVFLLTDIAELRDREFGLGFSYYFVVWGYLALCILGGALLLGGASLGKWLITSLAVLLVLYAVVIWAKAEGAPFWFQLWCGTMLAFGAWSIFLVQRRNA